MEIRDRILQEVGWKIRESDKADAASSVRTEMVLRIALAAAAVFFLFSFKVHTYLPYVAGAAAVLLAAGYYGHRTVFSRKLRAFLVRDCDPDHFLSYYCAVLQSAGRQKRWESHIYNVAQGLFYAGEFEKAGHLLKLYENECRSAEGDFRHDLAQALLAYQAGDLEQLRHCAALLGNESQRTRLNAELCDELDEAKALPHFLELEQKKQWKELYDAVNSARFYDALPLGQLKKQVYLEKAARGMQDTERASMHGNYVREHAGTTFYGRVQSE